MRAEFVAQQAELLGREQRKRGTLICFDKILSGWLCSGDANLKLVETQLRQPVAVSDRGGIARFSPLGPWYDSRLYTLLEIGRAHV